MYKKGRINVGYIGFSTAHYTVFGGTPFLLNMRITSFLTNKYSLESFCEVYMYHDLNTSAEFPYEMQALHFQQYVLYFFSELFTTEFKLDPQQSIILWQEKGMKI